MTTAAVATLLTLPAAEFTAPSSIAGLSALLVAVGLTLLGRRRKAPAPVPVRATRRRATRRP